MKLHPLSIVLLGVILTGCSKTKDTAAMPAPSRASPVPDVNRPGPTVPTVPQVAAKAMNLEQFLAEARNIVPFESVEFKLGKLEFLIHAPVGTVTTKEGLIEFPGGSGLEVEIAHDFDSRKAWWAEGGGFLTSKLALVDTADTLVTETTEPGDNRYHFDNVVTIGLLDLTVRNTKKGSAGAVVDYRSNIAMLLKATRSIKLKTPLPTDPAAAVESLGGSVYKDESGKVEGLKFEGNCTRSTLALLAKFPDLKTLKFTFSPLKAADMAPLKKLTKLEELSFHSVLFKDEGAEIIGGLTQLKKLSIEWGQITAKGIGHLKSLTNLTALYLDRNDLADLGPEPFAGMTKLESLYLKGTNAGDAPLKAVKGMPNLKRLSIGNFDGKVSDAGLENLHGLKQIESIDVQSTETTPAGIEKLKAALPKAMIRSGK